MGSLSDYSENKLLDHLYNTAYTPASTLYLALCTADPTDAGTGASMNEVANSGNYARTAIAFSAASARRVTQNGAVTFPQLTGSLGTATHWAIVDSATHGAGNMLAHGSLANSKTLQNGNTPSVATTEVYVEFSAGEISNYAANKLLDLMFTNTAYSRPTTYVALVTVAVGDTDTGSTITEPSGGSYARLLVNPNSGSTPKWALAASGVVDNASALNFPTATASWGTIVGVAIVDASSAGNVLQYDNAMVDEPVGNGDTVTFAVGALDCVMT